MDRLQRASVLTELMTRLREYGSWCGETHVQKSVYFLQEVLGVESGFEYILYKHGPYSFDLAAELTSLRADFLLELEHRSTGYGPSLVPTQTSRDLRSRFPKTLAKYSPQIDFVAKAFGSKGVADLEKLATALYVTREAGSQADVQARAKRLSELKPHVSLSESITAVEQLDILWTAADSLNESVPS
jgi:uncharacterized protein YwgA